MTTEYEAITESEWKDLATTEITHLTDEEKDYLPRAWDEWIARVKRDAAREALDGLAREALGVAGGNDENASAWVSRAVQGWAEEYRDTHYPEETP